MSSLMYISNFSRALLLDDGNSSTWQSQRRQTVDNLNINENILANLSYNLCIKGINAAYKYRNILIEKSIHRIGFYHQSKFNQNSGKFSHRDWMAFSFHNIDDDYR